MKFEDYDKCKKWTDKLVSDLLDEEISILRVKIEVPYNHKYIFQSIYIEAHFIPKDWGFPVSKNVGSQKLLATAREYDNTKFASFNEKWKTDHSLMLPEIELCLFDSYVEEDKEWFKVYPMRFSY